MLVTQSCPRLCHPVDCSPPGSSVFGISRQEYWNRLPFPIPGDPPDPGIEATSPESPPSPALAGIFFATEPPGKTRFVSVKVKTYPGRGDKRKSQHRSRVHKCCVYSFCVGHQNRFPPLIRIWQSSQKKLLWSSVY